jgi:hypothetical protein
MKLYQLAQMLGELPLISYFADDGNGARFLRGRRRGAPCVTLFPPVKHVHVRVREICALAMSAFGT